MKALELVLEQLGRLVITGTVMYVIVALMEMSILPETLAIISVLIWMLIPAVKMIKGAVQ